MDLCCIITIYTFHFSGPPIISTNRSDLRIMEEKDAFGKERLSFGNERDFLYQNSVTFYPIF